MTRNCFSHLSGACCSTIYTNVWFVTTINLYMKRANMKYVVFKILWFFHVDSQDINFDSKLDIHFGIAHTRWATHGVPNEPNSHPHRSCKQNGMSCCCWPVVICIFVAPLLLVVVLVLLLLLLLLLLQLFLLL